MQLGGLLALALICCIAVASGQGVRRQRSSDDYTRPGGDQDRGGGRRDYSQDRGGTDDDACVAVHCYRCRRGSRTECASCSSGYALDRYTYTCSACGSGCRSCERAGPGRCDPGECDSGYVREGYTETCEPCGSHCRSCEVAGPGRCDHGSCHARYAQDDQRRCAPCAFHCKSCDSAGPGRCDPGKCDSGYTRELSSMLQCVPCCQHCTRCETAGEGKCDRGQCHERCYLDSSSRCQACGRNCVACNAHSCSSCDWFHSLRFHSQPNGPWHCEFDPLAPSSIAVCVGAFALVVMLVFARRDLFALLPSWRDLFPSCYNSSAQSGPAEIQEAEDTSAEEAGTTVLQSSRRTAPPPYRRTTPEGHHPASAPTAIAAWYPSGAWKGYYTQHDGQHAVCEFQLVFSGASVSGEGIDDVGAYSFSGRVSGAQVSLSKTYSRGSRNIEGLVSDANEGHSVEYVGDPTRMQEDGRPFLAAGLRGSWSIRVQDFSDAGRFAIWPAMARDEYAAMEGHTLQGEEVDLECCVCMDRYIDTKLDPCGHEALCGTCAYRVTCCPLCRARVVRRKRV